MTDPITLKPCPFCGGEAKHKTEESSNGEYVECADCECTTPLVFSCGEDARERLTEIWNRRVRRAAEDGLRAEDENPLRIAGLIDLVAKANKECMAAETERDVANTACDAMRTERDAIMADREKLRADLAAMRPVVEAAVEWQSNWLHPDSPLIDAVKTYRAAKEAQHD